MANKKISVMLVDLIEELHCIAHATLTLGGNVLTIVPLKGEWEYCYRRIAYFTSSWEGVYITGIKQGTDITVFVEE